MSDVLRFASSDAPGRNPLRAQVEQRTGQDALSCYQCGKCSAGCPVIKYMDLGPQRVLRAIQMGQKDLLLRSSTIWLCVTCQTCNTRCPRKIDIPRIMDTLRFAARQAKIRPSEETVGAFHNAFLKDVELTGRLYEVGLIGGYLLASMRLLDGVDLAVNLGLPMFLKGKIDLKPQLLKGRGEMAEIFRRTAKMEP
jgi:heterodisulfide reductase subunit C2